MVISKASRDVSGRVLGRALVSKRKHRSLAGGIGRIPNEFGNRLPKNRFSPGAKKATRSGKTEKSHFRWTFLVGQGRPLGPEIAANSTSRPSAVIETVSVDQVQKGPVNSTIYGDGVLLSLAEF